MGCSNGKRRIPKILEREKGGYLVSEAFVTPRLFLGFPSYLMA
jgi:hypothetical protein